MHLFSSDAETFIRLARSDDLASDLSNAFESHFRHSPPVNEARSWRNSLARVADVLDAVGTGDVGVVVEYQLPLTSKRLDVMLTGSSGSDPHAVVVELKQWDSVAPSNIEECVETFVGGALRAQLHPSRQVAGYQQYLEDTQTAFTDGGIGISSRAFLHNLASDDAAALFADEFARIVAEHPCHLADGDEALTDAIAGRVGAGGGGDVMRTVLAGKYRPSKRLMDHIADVIQSESAYTLLDEQQIAANHITAQVRVAQLTDEHSIFIVEGGPGTGKSVVALHVMADLMRQGFTANHATGSKAFTENLRKALGSKSKAMFRYFNNFMEAPENLLDLIICDEAHRIRQTSNNQYTPAAKKSEIPQVDELVRAARTTVFFIDDRQIVRPGEVGSTDLLRDAARRAGANVYEHVLESQFRCNGSDAFIQWVDNTLGVTETPVTVWKHDDPFDFDVVDSPEELDHLIRSRNSGSDTARLVAGFCWPWTSPDGDGNLVADVRVGGWSMPWNAKPDAKRLAPGIPKSNYWATDPGGLGQVGCVYTAQGFEFDHVGVIWGRDLVHRDGVGWVAQSEFSHDSVVKRSAKKHPEQFRHLVAQTYRVLLTRGMKSCTLFFEDDETKDFVLSCVE